MTTDQNHPFHILGFGAIGVLLAAHTRLHFPSYPIQVLLRNHHQTKVLNGLIEVTIENPRSGGSETVSVPASIISELEQPIQNLVVTTKAFDAVDAVELVRQNLSDTTQILLLSNGGLAVREELIKQFAFKRELVQAGSVTHGAYRRSNRGRVADEPHSIVHAGDGRIFVPERLSQFASVWSSLHCAILQTEEMERVLWKKLAANAVCNPLTALHQVRNGELYELDGFEAMLTAIVSEVVEVHNSIKPAAPLDLEGMSSFVRQVIDDNLDNRSSMYQDIASRRKTEIQYLNGFVVDVGEESGIACPTNRRLVQEILTLESGYSD